MGVGGGVSGRKDFKQISKNRKTTFLFMEKVFFIALCVWLKCNHLKYIRTKA